MCFAGLLEDWKLKNQISSQEILSTVQRAWILFKISCSWMLYKETLTVFYLCHFCCADKFDFSNRRLFWLTLISQALLNRHLPFLPIHWCSILTTDIFNRFKQMNYCHKSDIKLVRVLLAYSVRGFYLCWDNLTLIFGGWR